MSVIATLEIALQRVYKSVNTFLFTSPREHHAADRDSECNFPRSNIDFALTTSQVLVILSLRASRYGCHVRASIIPAQAARHLETAVTH